MMVTNNSSSGMSQDEMPMGINVGQELLKWVMADDFPKHEMEYTCMTDPRRKPLRLDTSIPHIPRFLNELVSWHQWTVWRYEYRDNRWRGVAQADPHDASTWLSYEDASDLLVKSEDFYDPMQKWDCIGFVLTRRDPFFVVKLRRCASDYCRIQPWVRNLIRAFGTYGEYAPCKCGLTLIGRDWPHELRKEWDDDSQISMVDRDIVIPVTGMRIVNHEHQLRSFGTWSIGLKASSWRRVV